MRTVILLLFTVVTAGCFHMRAPLPGALRQDVGERLEVVGHFETQFTHYYVLHGAFGAPEEDLLYNALLSQARAHGADGVANVTVETSFRITGVAVAICTFSLLHPRTYKLTGDLVKIHAPPLRGRPVLTVNP